MSLTGFAVFVTAFNIFSIILLIISDIALNNKINKLEDNVERLKKIKEQE